MPKKTKPPKPASVDDAAIGGGVPHETFAIDDVRLDVYDFSAIDFGELPSIEPIDFSAIDAYELPPIEPIDFSAIDAFEMPPIEIDFSAIDAFEMPPIEFKFEPIGIELLNRDLKSSPRSVSGGASTPTTARRGPSPKSKPKSKTKPKPKRGNR